jgi:hypothetical protein
MKNKIYKLKLRIFGKLFLRPFTPLPSITDQEKYGYTLRTFTLRNTQKDESRNNEWINNSNILISDIQNNNPVDFINWRTIRETMFHIAKEPEFFAIKNSVIWKKYKSALQESSIGNPPPYPLYPTSSGNLIHHAYNILQLLQKFDFEIKDFKKIVEFGGGYGSTCRMIYNMGFIGSYVIFDIPEFSALQRYFLSMLNMYKKFNIKLTNDLNDDLRDPDLCIMTWSLSEVPIDLRSKFVAKLGKPKYFLIAYQKSFSSIDNIQYFDGFKKLYSNYEWFEYEIPHLKSNYYLVGKRNV